MNVFKASAIFAIICFTTYRGLAEEAEAHECHASELESPEISAFIDIQALSSDADDRPDNEKLRVKEAELGFKGYITPSVRGDVILALEQEYLSSGSVDTEVHLEEAFATFLDLPVGIEAAIGRKLVGFGVLNTIHPHHWDFADTPLVMNALFGDHPWFDDGAELGVPILNPTGIGLKMSVGVWNGNEIAHGHAHEDVEGEADHVEDDHDDDEGSDHDDGEVIEWDGNIFSGRVIADFPFTDRLSVQAGYSVVGDEGHNLLQGADLVFNYSWPQSHRRLKWHTEGYAFDSDNGESDPSGLFSVLGLTMDDHWAFGGRYDKTELLADDGQDAWAGTGFVSYYLTHTTYVRGQYQYKEHGDGEEENSVTAQLVWGIGPHAH